MSGLMRSVSGIRGIVGDSLTPPLVLNYVNAFLQITKASKVVIGRDTRSSGSMLENLVVQGCAASGVKAIVLGISSTPTVEMMVPRLKAEGGIVITASHNPIEWNALKFLNSEGSCLNEKEVRKLFKLVDDGSFKWSDYCSLKPFSTRRGGDDFHINSILKLPFVNAGKIRKRKFKVAYDGVNGAGSVIVPKLLSKLGCKIVAINI